MKGSAPGRRARVGLVKLASTAAIAAAIAGCAATTPPGPAGSGAANPPGASVTVGSLPAGPKSSPDFLGNVPEDLFTEAPNPLTLAVSTADDLATEKSIGPDGGSITAKGTDGTSYTLAIPAHALPLSMPIGMTPISSVSGFPAGMNPAGHLGVVLAPDGLTLAATATLTIHPAAAIDGALAVVDFEGAGGDAALHVFDRGPTDVTIPIDHFSGYTAEYPVTVTEIKTFAQQYQAFLEKTLESAIAGEIGIERQYEVMGLAEENGRDLVKLAETYLERFKQVVLTPRIAAAPQGCTQSELAIAAIASYERQRQILALEDPKFAATPAGTIVPPTLMDLAVRLCFREAYKFCADTGDFPGLAVYMFGMFARNENMLGIPPSQAQLDLAQGYLTRCGRWRLNVDTSELTDDKISGIVTTIESGREIDLQWEAGSGKYGIERSTIKGEAPIDVTAFKTFDAKAGECGQTRYSGIQTKQNSAAEIVDLRFDRYEGPTLTGVALPPVPAKLKVRVDLGVLDYGYQPCARGTVEHGVYSFPHVDQLVNGQDTELTMTPVTVEASSDWSFTTKPFKATRTPWEGTVKNPFGTPTKAKLEMKLEHTPGP